MFNFRNLTPTSGFDSRDLNNARQNNYAWSMSDLGDYIYVGTGRNILINIIRALEPNTNLPALIDACPIDNLAEIWRYKKDGTLPWMRVYKSSPESQITGFRYMMKHKPFKGSLALYAAGFASTVKILKSTNGVNWFTLDNNSLEGTSSRAMLTHNGYLYVATINESNPSEQSLLYRSEDPEFIPWERVINNNAPGFDPNKNPSGSISNMAVFNNRLYVATVASDGVQVWRTNESEPELNDWTLVADKGFGNPLNRYTLAMGVFKNHLYVSATKPLPLSWFIPMGCDVVRIDKKDNTEIIVGGNPLIDFNHQKNDEFSMSMLSSGFNNPFNVYAWQIQEYQGKLLITTFDDSMNMEVILTTLLANRAALSQIIGERITDLLIFIYKTVVRLLRAVRYPIGFDLYVSEDGVNFKSLSLNGLGNATNYGGRILYKDSRKELYLGTANPFQGCEVYKTCYIDNRHSKLCLENYSSLWNARKILTDNFEVINKNIPAIMKFMPENYRQMF